MATRFEQRFRPRVSFAGPASGPVANNRGPGGEVPALGGTPGVRRLGRLVDLWRLLALPLINSSNHEDWLTVFLALGASFLRTTTAVLLGAAWTLPVGILIGRSPRWSQRLQPVIQVLASFPAPMLFLPVTALLLHLRINFNIGCTALMLLGTQWYILFNVIAGASSIPADLKEVTSVFRWTRPQRGSGFTSPAFLPISSRA